MLNVIIRWITLSLLFTVVACAPSSKEEVSKTSNDPAAYQVVIFNEGDQLKARYELPEALSELNLTDRDSQQRKDGWTVADAAFEFNGKKVTRTDGEPFRQVTFNLSRDSRFFDRRYVVTDEIGPMSWSVYLTAFRVDEQPTTVTFQSKDPLVVRIGARPYDLDEPYTLDDRSTMSYFGQADFVRDGNPVIVAGPDIPASLVDTVSDEVSQTMAVFDVRIWGFRHQSAHDLYYHGAI